MKVMKLEAAMKTNGCLMAVLGAALVMLPACKKEDETVDIVKGKSPEVMKLRVCINRDGVLVRALTYYNFDVGTYPTTEQGFAALLERPSGLDNPEKWKGPYLDNEDCLTDPWGTELKYVFPGKTHEGKYDIWSAGPDKQFDTSDDILHWKER